MRFTRRVATIIKWTLVSLLLLTAVVTGAMRLLLPNLDTAKAPMQKWANEVSGFSVDFGSFKGHWRNLVPSLTLHDLSLSTASRHHTVLTADSIDIQIDLWRTLTTWEPTFSNVSIDGLRLDLTQLPARNDKEETGLKKQLEQLFLVGLGHFSVHDAKLVVMSASDERKTIAIESLIWDNQAGQHHVQGVVSVEGTSLSQVDIRGVFTESRGLTSLDGEFYVKADDVSLQEWVSSYVNPEFKLFSATVGGEAWLTVEQGLPRKALLNISDTAVAWGPKSAAIESQGRTRSVSIPQGQVFLTRDSKDEWHLATNGFAIKTGEKHWPEPHVKLSVTGDDWKLNVDELDIKLLTPLTEIVALPDGVENALQQLAPAGTVRDLRVAKKQGEEVAYSASVRHLAFNHWTYLPEVHKLNAQILGVGTQGKAVLSMKDDILPYGNFFQAPLNIKRGDVSIYWDYNDTRTVIWSDHVAVAAPHINVIGEFRLDLPHDGEPWLAFYAEANANDAGETWRYLPTLALGFELTDYLSSAIRGGQAEHAKLVWFGDFDTFPYLKNEGVFQAYVPLKNGQFSFDTQWPTLTDLRLDLLFQNDSMFLDASNVRLMKARGYNVKGQIPSFSEDYSKLLINADIQATGDELHEYMLATPLVDSVGAALTHVQVDGKVTGSIDLNIPLNGDDVDAKGSVRLKDNVVSIVSPEMTLNKVGGTIEFHNDIVWSKGFDAVVLEQPISVGFNGETESDNYLVDIDIKGNWQADKLKAALDLSDLDLVEGESRWDLDVGIALKDIGFTYDVKLDADLANMRVHLPAPLDNLVLQKSKGTLRASGNGERLVGQVTLPNVKYQADVDIQGELPEVLRSRLVVGEGELSLHPLLGNAVSIDVSTLDMAAWKGVIDRLLEADSKHDKPFPVIVPEPSRVNVKAKKMLAGELTFNNFSMAARQKSDGFHILVGSEELAGDAWWDGHKRLTVSIEHLFLNVDLEDDADGDVEPTRDTSFASKADKGVMANIPSTDLVINELWVQGYRLGRVEAQLLKSNNTLTLSKMSIGSGDTRFTANGKWAITEKGLNESRIKFDIQGNNSSDLMGRFAVSGGIQDAKFMTKADLNFNGTPWSINLATLNGSVDTKLKDGYVSGVGGAGRLLGLFSLDSILRKMQLDFTGVFEDGLAFDEISGSAAITNGVVVTDNIQMNALAGDMFIKGIANLVENQVNADVRFVPDLTSGIPVFTAFAVTPQTALYVLAVTTVISPVVDAFTQVRYQVTGAIDDPVVRELSRITGEVTLPEQATERLRTEQQGSKPQ
ncbi:TIGR02099 family protein [Enterovibrio sp. ZSDZ35]|uniref:TIGR02099 family protein n=1 Tax=Enterovibrio qingdaonensis TaxID=2899818 RepID=A0ABT5QMK0_9GAMM|nr:YhdP family protein [Enterovibrio sp. ZSDZ35]MDD1782214.1 TIGR02099 family protein [Enterovibrio sp. ZSDZ35]